MKSALYALKLAAANVVALPALLAGTVAFVAGTVVGASVAMYRRGREVAYAAIKDARS